MDVKQFAWFAVALLLTGCAAMSRDPEVMKERERTRLYAVCMKQQLGPFGTFASPESKRRAAEECRKLVSPDPAQPAAT